LKNRNALLEEERALSELGILGANDTKIFDFHLQPLSICNLLTYNSHHVHYITADPARKNCFAGTFRTLDNICKDCPVGTWSKDAATRCCPDGQYEGLNALCENCPAGKYLTWSKCRSSENNKCRTCQKGKVRENRSKSRLRQFVLNHGRTIFACICQMISSIRILSIFLSSHLLAFIQLFSLSIFIYLFIYCFFCSYFHSHFFVFPEGFPGRISCLYGVHSWHVR
jgi:hypothetical protein